MTSHVAYSDLQAMCDSEAEHVFLWQLSKVVGGDILQQVAVSGYRLDFVTNGGIGWEVDGAQFHDVKRDSDRDQRILANHKDIRAIVRVPAAVLWWHHEATIAAIRWITGSRVPEWGCLITPGEAIDVADSYVDAIRSGSELDDEPFTGMSLFDVQPDSHRVQIGSPGYCVPKNHSMWEQVEPGRHALMRWCGKITWSGSLPASQNQQTRRVVCRMGQCRMPVDADEYFGKVLRVYDRPLAPDPFDDPV